MTVTFWLRFATLMIGSYAAGVAACRMVIARRSSTVQDTLFRAGIVVSGLSAAFFRVTSIAVQAPLQARDFVALVIVSLFAGAVSLKTTSEHRAEGE